MFVKSHRIKFNIHIQRIKEQDIDFTKADAFERMCIVAGSTKFRLKYIPGYYKLECL